MGAFVVILLVSIAPLVFATYPPLMDYPFHLARVHILANWKASPLLQDWYEIGSFILPNMGMDLVGLGLAKLFPLLVAGRVFLALTLAIILSGCLVLHRSVHGYFSWWPLTSSLFLFNWIFLFGLTNYVLGVGLMLWAAAIWVALNGTAPWFRFVCGTLLSVALFFCHLVSVGEFAIIVAGYELQRNAATVRVRPWIAFRDLLTRAAIFIAPVLLFMASSTAGAAAEAWRFAQPWWNRFAAYRTLGSSSIPADALMLLVFFTGAIIVALYGRVQIAKSMYLPLAMLVVAHLVAPSLLYSSALLDVRLPIAILFVAVGSTQAFFKSEVYKWVVASNLAILLVFRSMMFAYDWRQYDQVIKPIVATFAKFPPGSTLFVAREDDPDYWSYFMGFGRLDRRAWQPQLNHVGSLATLEQPVFVPTTFADRAQQPIVITAKYAKLYDFQGRDPIRLNNSRSSGRTRFFAGGRTAMTEQIRHLLVDAGLPLSPVFLLILYPEFLHLPPPDGTAVFAKGTHFLVLALSGV